MPTPTEVVPMAEETRLDRIETNLLGLSKEMRELVQVQVHIVHILEDSRRIATRVGKLEDSVTINTQRLLVLETRTELQSSWLRKLGSGLGVLFLTAIIYAFATVWKKVTGI